MVKPNLPFTHKLIKKSSLEKILINQNRILTLISQNKELVDDLNKQFFEMNLPAGISVQDLCNYETFGKNLTLES